MNKTVACCYLTHNHPEAMREALENICEEYTGYGIDIYVYGSGDEGETNRITEEYSKKYPGQVFYVDAGFARSGDEKYLYVMQGNGLIKHYDYIWPTKDRCRFTGDTLEKIVSAIDEDRDVIYAVDERDRYEFRVPKYKDEYSDAVEFFADYGALSANWEALIRKTDTMLTPIDWAEYDRRYGVNINNNFNQTLTLFARLSELENVSVGVIHIKPGDKIYSQKAESMWKNETLKIWVDKWIPAIFNLPNIYDGYKQYVIKTQLGHPSLFGSVDSLIIMRDAGQFTPEKFEELAPMWEMLSRIPVNTVRKIMKNEDEEVGRENLESFYRSFEEKDYEKAFYLFLQNRWMEDYIGEENYNILNICFTVLVENLKNDGYSLLFEGVDSVEGLIRNYYYYSGKKG